MHEGMIVTNDEVAVITEGEQMTFEVEQDKEPVTVQGVLAEMRENMTAVISNFNVIAKHLVEQADAQHAQLRALALAICKNRDDVAETRSTIQQFVTGLVEADEGFGAIDETLNRTCDHLDEIAYIGAPSTVMGYCDDCGEAVYDGQPHGFIEGNIYCADCYDAYVNEIANAEDAEGITDENKD